MEVRHCGVVLDTFRDRVIKPTDEEQAQGLVSVMVREYWCNEDACRQKLYYRQDFYEIGSSPVSRVKPRQVARLKARLKQAGESDWVWGWNKETYGKVKVWVR